MRPSRSSGLRRLRSRLLTLFLAYLLVGLGHQLYARMRLDVADGLFRDSETLAEKRLAGRMPDDIGAVALLLTDDHSCSAVPFSGTRLLLTAAHCVFTETGEPLAADEVGLLLPGGSAGEARKPTRIVPHGRYTSVASSEMPALLGMLRDALLWSSVRGPDPSRFRHLSDLAVIELAGPPLDAGVDGAQLGGDPADPLLVAFQAYSPEGTPICTLADEHRCPEGTLTAGSGERGSSRPVTCAPEYLAPGIDVDIWVPCGFFPGSSGGGLVSRSKGGLLLRGVLVSGDPVSFGNGVVSLDRLDRSQREVLCRGGVSSLCP